MTIVLDLPPELEGQLEKAARTQGKDISTFLLDSARLQLRQDVLSESEANLLQIVNAPLVPEARKERDMLLAEQTRCELTQEERATLTRLIDEVEMANAKRWQSIAELAQRRGLSLAEIARDLEIPLS